MTWDEFEKLANVIGEFGRTYAQFNVGESARILAIEIADMLSELDPPNFNRYMFLVRTNLWEGWETIPMKGDDPL